MRSARPAYRAPPESMVRAAEGLERRAAEPAVAAGLPLPLPGEALAAQPAHQQRVVGQGRRLVDDRRERAVVLLRRESEPGTSGDVLRVGVLPPVALEGEDLAIPGAQLGHASILSKHRLPPELGGLV